MKFAYNLILIFFISSRLAAQILDPVHWESKINSIGNQEYELIISATMDKGWCIYSQTSDPNGAIPTEVTIEKNSSIELLGKVEERGKLKKAPEPLFENAILAKYYDHVDFVQKFKAAGPLNTLKASTYFMACNSETCIPPTTKEFTLSLNNQSSPAQNEEIKKTGGGGMPMNIDPVISADINPESQTIFDPIKVQASLKKISEKQFAVQFETTIEKGWHIYSSDLPSDDGPRGSGIEFTKDDNFSLDGKVEEICEHKWSGYDDIFEMNVTKFKEKASFTQKINIVDITKPVKGFFTYQTCDASKCLPPKNLAFEILADKNTILLEGNSPAGGTGLKIDGNKLDQVIPQIKESLVSPVGNCGEENIKGANHFWTFLFGFLGGLVALLTPCVFPMIPLTVSFFLKGSKDKKSGIKNGILYGLSIILIYVVLGTLINIIAGPTALNDLSTNWIANVIFFIIFIVFALSFFGFFEITLPSSWSNKSDAMADKGGVIGIFFMAFTLAIVSFSCTGPIIGSAIVESARSSSLGPVIVMCGFSLALALPFGLFAAFPALLNTLPKSGGWMTNVKVVLGFIELALALKFLSTADMTKHWGILGYEIFMGLWLILFALTGIYLLGWIKFPHDSPIKKLSIPRFSFALLFLGIAVYLGFGFRYSEKYQSYTSLSLMSGLAPPSTYNYFLKKPDVDPEIKARFPSFTKCANNIDCFHDYYEGLTYAKEKGLPIFIDFTGYACVNCRKTEEHIWVNDKIRNSLMKDFVLVSLYVDDKEMLNEQYISVHTKNPIRNVGNKWADFQIVNFNQNSQPLYVVMSPDEKIITKPRGYHPDIEEYRTFLECGLKAYKEYSSSVGIQ
ncbi:MAG: hypothetical protein HOP11_13150 [Saprospiraceae bacterium]|nr:hypothetical protein [Saprospiraceae bacterium]